MKKLIFLLLSLPLVLWSCDKDNYDPPTISFTGQLMYNGQPLPFNGNTDVGEGSEIIQLFQYGFGKNGALNVRVNRDGHFSALLFAGDYTMTFADRDYPFVFDDWPMRANGRPDSIAFTLTGDMQMNINVTPLLEVSDVEYSVGGTTVNAEFRIAQTQAGRTNATKAYLYMSTAMNVNKSTPLNQAVTIDDPDGVVSIKLPILKYRETYVNNFRPYAFVRVAVETDRSGEYIWSPVYKVEGIPVAVQAVDVTKTYLLNTGPGFTTLAGSAAPASSFADITAILAALKSTPADWTVTAPVKIYDGWGGIDQRWGRDRICVVNWDSPTKTILGGKIYQTTTAVVPAGRYALTASWGEMAASNGVKNHCCMIVNKGADNMPDWAARTGAFKCTDVGEDETIEFELTDPTTLTIGFLYNFPTSGEQCAYGFDWLKLYRYND